MAAAPARIGVAHRPPAWKLSTIAPASWAKRKAAPTSSGSPRSTRQVTTRRVDSAPNASPARSGWLVRHGMTTRGSRRAHRRAGRPSGVARARVVLESGAGPAPVLGPAPAARLGRLHEQVDARQRRFRILPFRHAAREQRDDARMRQASGGAGFGEPILAREDMVLVRPVLEDGEDAMLGLAPEQIELRPRALLGAEQLEHVVLVRPEAGPQRATARKHAAPARHVAATARPGSTPAPPAATARAPPNCPAAAASPSGRAWPPGRSAAAPSG